MTCTVGWNKEHTHTETQAKEEEEGERVNKCSRVDEKLIKNPPSEQSTSSLFASEPWTGYIVQWETQLFLISSLNCELTYIARVKVLLALVPFPLQTTSLAPPNASNVATFASHGCITWYISSFDLQGKVFSLFPFLLSLQLHHKQQQRQRQMQFK